jgi:hypothetical protein
MAKRKTRVKTTKGAGDMVEKITKKTGVKKVVELFANGKDCGCDKRKEKLNAIRVPKKITVNCFDETQYNEYKNFIDTRKVKMLGASKGKGTLSVKEVSFVSNLYANITNTPPFKPCSTCSAKPVIRMIEVLDQVFNTYTL